MTPEAQAALDEFLATTARKWVEEWIRQRQAYFEKRKMKASGALSDSMGYQLSTALSGAIRAELEVGFQEHGRYLDMKRLDTPGGGDDLIIGLVNWIKKRGLESKFEKGFLARKKLKKLPQNWLNQAAWGIAVKRQKGYRRRAWYAKSSSAAVTDLYNHIAAGLPDIVSSELKKAIERG